MEYSVFDLIRILLRKWYLIVLVMAIVSGVSVFTSRASYEKALADYESYTTETVPTGDTGTLTVSVRYDYTVTDISEYVDAAQQEADFIQQFSEEAGESQQEQSQSLSELYGHQAYASFQSQLAQLPQDALLLANVQQDISASGMKEPPYVDDRGRFITPDTPLTVSDYLQVTADGTTGLTLTITGLEESSAQKIVESYLENFQALGQSSYNADITNITVESSFTPDPVQYTESAEFAQTVMKKPEQRPILIKTMGTAAMYAFVFACFGVLLYTFIKDSRSKTGEDTEVSGHA